MIKDDIQPKTICISSIGSVVIFSYIVDEYDFSGVVSDHLNPTLSSCPTPYHVDTLRRRAFYTVEDLEDNLNASPFSLAVAHASAVEYYKAYKQKNAILNTSNTSSCNHEYINVGFTSLKMVCNRYQNSLLRSLFYTEKDIKNKKNIPKHVNSLYHKHLDKINRNDWSTESV